VAPAIHSEVQTSHRERTLANLTGRDGDQTQVETMRANGTNGGLASAKQRRTSEAFDFEAEVDGVGDGL
jgi:hypothetical protein